MYIGSGALLLVVGAILKFAVKNQAVGGVDLGTIGIICMIAGAALIVLSLLMQSRRRTATTDRVLRGNDGRVTGTESVEHRDTY